MTRWTVIAEVDSASRIAEIQGETPKGVDIVLIAPSRLRMRLFGVKNINFVDDPLSCLANEVPDHDTAKIIVPLHVRPSKRFFEQMIDLDSNYGHCLVEIVDRSGIAHVPSKWAVGAVVLGTGTGDVAASAVQAFTSLSISEMESGSCHQDVDTKIPRVSIDPKEDRQVRLVGVDEVGKRSSIDTRSSMIDIALLISAGIKKPKHAFSDEDTLGDQEHNEIAVRKLAGHWIAILYGEGAYSWDDVFEIAASRRDRDMILLPGLALVSPSSARKMPPLTVPVPEWIEACRKDGRLSICQLDSSCGLVSSTSVRAVEKSGRNLRVAVLSMCGVTSLEDRYGLGGEHQVVHWLREGFLDHPDVELCDVFDTINLPLAENGFYDIVFSNSCWCPPPQTRDGGSSIFWHFNTNAYRGSEQSIVDMGYGSAWTNSPISLKQFQGMGVPCFMKHLNASTLYHVPYRYDSRLFKHDAVYVGGYQVEYKSKKLIDRYVKVLCRDDLGIDFAIYGNRRWKHRVQLEAVKVDSGFRNEHVDPTFDPYYKHVLHPLDFTILCKNAKVWVNFNAEDQRPLGMVNDRPIWGMACGAFFITDDTPEQRALYGDTCDYSDGGDDLVDKVRYWTDPSRDRERVERGVAAAENIRNKRLLTHDTAAIVIEQHLGRDRKAHDGRVSNG